MWAAYSLYDGLNTRTEGGEIRMKERRDNQTPFTTTQVLLKLRETNENGYDVHAYKKNISECKIVHLFVKAF